MESVKKTVRHTLLKLAVFQFNPKGDDTTDVLSMLLGWHDLPASSWGRALISPQVRVLKVINNMSIANLHISAHHPDKPRF